MTAGITTKTTCPYCGVGCGVLATPQLDGSVAIKETLIILPTSAACVQKARLLAKHSL